MDRENVEKALDCRADGFGLDCKDCAYYREDTLAYCNFRQILRDAISLLKEQEDMGKELTDAMELVHKKNARIIELTDLLKEQEAVEPKHNPLSPTDWFCGKCGMCISRFHDYCPSCGNAVKWE